MRTYIRYYIYRTFYVFIKCIYTSLGRHTKNQFFAYHSVVLDAIFPQRRPPGPEVLDAHAKGAVAWAQLESTGFSTTGASLLYETHYCWAFETQKNVWKISSLSFTMIDDPRLHSSSISSVVWNGCLTFSASWSLSKCCRKQSYWQNQSARHARARSSKTSRLSLEITVPCLEMVRRRSFLFGMACFLGSSKR